MARSERKRRLLVSLPAALLLAAVCVTAGLWQIGRYDEKRGNNQILQENDSRAAVRVDQLLSVGRPLPSGQEFRKVTARGTYDNDGQYLVRRREVDDQPAFVVVTPLRLDSGITLLVARGWIPASGPAVETPPIPAAPIREVTVTGRVHPGENGRSRPNGDQLPARQINAINPAELAQQLTTEIYDGYVELIDQQPDPENSELRAFPPPSLSNPAGGATQIQHLAYVVQWFVFGALALIAPFLLPRLDAKRANPNPHSPQLTQHQTGNALNARSHAP